LCFFFQAEDGIRDRNVTGVQTCALPIYRVVDHADLETTAIEWAWKINTKSPTAQRMLKFAFNLTDDGLMGQQVFAGEATRLAYKIGRASCRERVEIRVGAETSEKERVKK